MIVTIQGKVSEKFNESIVVEANGIGYQLLVSAPTFENIQINTDVKLYVYEHLREDRHDLYGFSEYSEKSMFETLSSVNGVGPKMALALLSLGSERISTAIATGDKAVLQSVKGVGKRLAERLIVELKDKIGAVSTASMSPAKTGAREALISLGYSASQADKALSQIDQDIETEEEQVKQALKQLS